MKTKNYRKILIIITIVLLVILAIVYSIYAIYFSELNEDEETEMLLPPNLYSSSQYVIGTGNKLGTYFPAGQILTNWFNDNLEKNKGGFLAYQTNGSIDNINLLQKRLIQFGMSESRVAKEAYSMNNSIRVVWPLWFDIVHIVTPPKEVMNEYVFPGADAAFLGQKNSSTERTSNEILSALNIKLKTKSNIHFDSVIDKVAYGKLGFAMIQAGIPNNTVSNAIVFYRCGLYSFSEEQLQLIRKNVSTYVDFKIPAGYYEESQPEINTFALPNVMVSTTDVSPEVVELFVDLLINACTRLKNRFKAFETVPSDINEVVKILENTNVPLHEGTKRWLEKQTKPKETK